MKFWNWKDTPDGEPRELTLDGPIASESWFGDEVVPNEFKETLNKGTGDIVLWINSPGGDVVAASDIYTMLKEYPGKVTVKIDGVAASAASVVAMSGDKVLMSPTAIMMIHNPMTIALGDHRDMETAKRWLDEFKNAIVNAYELKTGLPRDKISGMMDDETPMAAKKAIELGFADGMLYERDAAVSTAFTPQRVVALQGFVSKMQAQKPQKLRLNGAGEDVIRYAELRGRLERIKY